MGESRTELLAWVNDLLQINYTKVEQAGTGKAIQVKYSELFILTVTPLYLDNMKDLPTVKSWTQFTVRYKKGTNIAM
jgi:hypothetical protein